VRGRSFARVIRHRRLPDAVYSSLLSAMQYQGADLGSSQLEIFAPPPYEFRHAQRQIALNALADVLITAGYHDAMIWQTERPAFRIRSTTGEIALVDIAEVPGPWSVPSESILHELRKLVSSDVYGSPERMQRIHDRFLSFRLPDVPPEAKLADYCDEIRRFVDSEDALGLTVDATAPVPPAYQALHAGQVRYTLTPSLVTAIEVALQRWFRPIALAASAFYVLEEKKSVGSEFADSPSWLVLSVPDTGRRGEVALELLSTLALDPLPFERVLVGNRALVLEYSVR
jgi:hypothetical protein